MCLSMWTRYTSVTNKQTEEQANGVSHCHSTHRLSISIYDSQMTNILQQRLFCLSYHKWPGQNERK